MNRALLKPLGVALTATSLLFASGCMGSFTLTKKIYRWNQHVSGDRWVNEIVFLVGLILPVYSLSLLADGVIFNSIQWWTGSNPVADAGQQKRVIGADGSLAVMTLQADGSIAVKATSPEGDIATFALRRQGDQVTALGMDGSPLDIARL